MQNEIASLNGILQLKLRGKKVEFSSSRSIEKYYKENNVTLSSEKDYLELVHPEDISKIENLLTRLRSNQVHESQIEYRILSKKMKTSWVLAHLNFYPSKKDETFTIKANQLDITFLKNHKTQLQRSNKELEQFAYVISHDLQSPIRQIWTYSEIIESKLDRETNSNLLPYLKSIQKTSQHMKQLTQDLLELCQIGRSELNFSVVNPQEVIESAKNILINEIKDSQAQINIIAKELPLKMTANERYLTDIFVNLFSNSIKYKKENSSPFIQIDYSLENNLHCFTIIDHGKGIPVNLQNKLFKIFKRGNKKQLGSVAGIGIGLSTVKKIIEIHKGEITIDPNFTDGAKFQFYIPVI